jgi:hypothetical protein
MNELFNLPGDGLEIRSTFGPPLQDPLPPFRCLILRQSFRHKRPELEQAVLGALMLERNAVNEAIDILQPESFYVDTHRKIFDAILGLFRNDQPIDILTVTRN